MRHHRNWTGRFLCVSEVSIGVPQAASFLARLRVHGRPVTLRIMGFLPEELQAGAFVFDAFLCASVQGFWLPDQLLLLTWRSPSVFCDRGNFGPWGSSWRTLWVFSVRARLHVVGIFLFLAFCVPCGDQDSDYCVSTPPGVVRKRIFFTHACTSSMSCRPRTALAQTRAVSTRGPQ